MSPRQLNLPRVQLNEWDEEEQGNDTTLVDHSAAITTKITKGSVELTHDVLARWQLFHEQKLQVSAPIHRLQQVLFHKSSNAVAFKLNQNRAVHTSVKTPEAAN